MPIPQQEEQFTRGHFMTRLISIRPPTQLPLRKTFQYQIKSAAVKNEQFQRRVSAVGENKERSGQWIFTQLPAAQSNQAINAFSKIGGVDGKQNALRRTEREHKTSYLKKLPASLFTYSGSGNCPSIRIRIPSGRSNTRLRPEAEGMNTRSNDISWKAMAGESVISFFLSLAVMMPDWIAFSRSLVMFRLNSRATRVIPAEGI
jgi:hypothetical protein